MRYHQLRQRADRVREIPLEAVLACRGAWRDAHDKAAWHTEQGPISVTGQKFTNWHRHTGGGKAIDLVMHLAELDFADAVVWLETHFGPAVSQERTGGHSSIPRGKGMEDAQRSDPTREGRPGEAVEHAESRSLRLPARDDRQLQRVRQYLMRQRSLPRGCLEPLIAAGKLYADRRGNAVFLLLGRGQQPVGAELRGTGPRVWRGMAPGTRKDRGCFWSGSADAGGAVLCESAIDAISCSLLFHDAICISTSGARPDPGWMEALIRRGYVIYCGFDTDEVGEAMAQAMMRLHPRVRRLRPPAHDWNDVLTSRRRVP
jgi:hypothetical protein